VRLRLKTVDNSIVDTFLYFDILINEDSN
jgi:hypothetical protein